MTFDFKHFILSHLIWVAVAIAGGVGFYSWKGEHDSRLFSDAQVASSNAAVKSLQQQIVSRDAQAAKEQQVIVKVIRDVQTPQQAVIQLPEVLTNPLPKPVALTPEGNAVIPMPDIVPLFQQLADDKLCRSQLAVTVADLSDEKTIVTQRDSEIAALKKKPSFWHRVAGTMKAVGVGIGIGIAAGKVL
jgi:hypothetical protein